MSGYVVELDVSVADWKPDCVSCGRPIENWSDAVALPASQIEDDEPTSLVLTHRWHCEDSP